MNKMSNQTTLRNPNSSLMSRLLLLLLIGSQCLSAQQVVPGPTSSTSTSSGSATSSTDDTAAITSATAVGQSTDGIDGQPVLTTQQILRLLQQKPELVTELKSLAADQLTQLGTPTQADSISDEMLYRQIAVSPEFRATITRWLLARGYTPLDDLQGMSPGGDGMLGDGNSGSRDASSFDPLKDGAGLLGASANASLPSGLDGQPSRDPAG